MKADSFQFLWALVFSIVFHIGVGTALEDWGRSLAPSIGESEVPQTVLKFQSVTKQVQDSQVEVLEPEPLNVVPPEKEKPVLEKRSLKQPKQLESQTKRITAPSSGDREAQQAMAVSFESELLGWLARHKQYPNMARRRGIEGTAILQFTVSFQGELLDADLGASSGSEVLDQEVIAMAERAVPFPRFPAALRKKTLTLSVPISFELR